MPRLALPHLKQCPPGHYHDEHATAKESVFKPYEVISLDGLIRRSDDYWRQREHPSSTQQRAGVSDVGLYPSTPRVKCHTPGCTNKASENHKDCSSCRSRRLAKCACGRVRSYGATRCHVCVTVDRRIRARQNWQASV